jgi:histidinol-phosphate aminotransferase
MSLRLHGDTLARPGMLDFAVNVWPAPRPPALEQALQRALATSDRYPNEQAAREATAARHGRRVDEVLLLNGACEAFWLLAHAYRPSLSACVHPSFTEPEAALRSVGSEITHVYREPEQWTFSPGEVPEEASVVVVGNPNNPTGGVDTPETITALARRWRLLVVDESFIDFVPATGASRIYRSARPVRILTSRSNTSAWASARRHRAQGDPRAPDCADGRSRFRWPFGGRTHASIGTTADRRRRRVHAWTRANARPRLHGTRRWCPSTCTVTS